jgi:hypothetical protein
VSLLLGSVWSVSLHEDDDDCAGGCGDERSSYRLLLRGAISRMFSAYRLEYHGSI